ncbi:acyl-CoA N-acyltransferase [Rhizodiscina lignyota]|uniref:Acyl-CoA N-acyltransferase n=1 Tax=Rhizodiscina lignyota TaxID=1504668 RepID=A0A9P4I8Y4_9PEZI|nr:acyl-CoA N-acyltransferase [Rhizodiscina lignyota]
MSFPQWNEILTQRLRLRPLTLEDAPDVYALRSFEEVYRWSVRPKWLSLSEAEEWIGQRLERPQNFQYCAELLDPSMVDPSTPKVIATMGVVGSQELGYQFHPATWGKGIATEAVSAFVKELSRHPDLVDMNKLEAWVAEENKGSQRVLEKVGFLRKEERVVQDGGDEEKVELSHEELAELRKSVEAMNLPTKGEISPIRPRRMIKLIIFEIDKTKLGTQS